MLHEFKQHIRHSYPELLSTRFVLACSGGVDSVVLAHICNDCNMDFAIAHCNFKLRGDASDKDEESVRQLAKELDKQCYVTHFDTLGYMNKNNLSLQIAARELRYEWFYGIMSKNKINILVTAHHADDNLETFLINLSRGTGIEGLTGIPAKTDTICRPLLPFSRSKIMVYAQENGYAWREDESNKDTKYLRNKIRLEVIPKLKELHPSFLDNFKNTIKYLGETNEISRQQLLYIKEQLFIPDNNMIRIPVEALKELSPISAYLFGLFSPFGFKEPDQVNDLLESMSGKLLVSKTHRLLKDRGNLLLSEISNSSNKKETYDLPEGVLKITEPLEISITHSDKRNDNTQNVIFVDKNTLNYPLTLRKWNNGDYFYPIGLKGKKKLAKFFKDEKTSVFSKEEQWLLCSEDKIVWVIGKRADERFKVEENTKEIVRIEVKNI
jgi:tRNA(Ile)-lysidine synthase